MKTFVSKGDALDLVAPYAVSSGGGMKVGGIIAIAVMDAAIGATVAGLVTGVVDVPSDTGTVWAVGDVVYWDDTAKVFTKTTTSNTKAGQVTAAKLSAATTGRIRLQPAF
jgi:predicted RecA/RadA family phage recombinase